MPEINVATFLPLIGEITVALADGRIDNAERVRLGEALGRLVAALTISAPAPQPAPVAAVTPVAPAPVPVTPAPAPVAGRKLRIVALKARVTSIYDRDNVTGVGQAATDNVLSGGNMDNGWHLHTDCTPVLEDGTELLTGDSRWNDVNHWAPNGNAIFPYYEYDGKLTSILAGDIGSPFVDPKSFEDNEGCNVTFGVETPEPHNSQHTFRFGYMHRNWDGDVVLSGLIGQGNRPDGLAFLVR